MQERQHLPLAVIEVDGIRMDQHVIPHLGEWGHMINFLVVQAGSPDLFLCVHIRITAARSRFPFIHTGLCKSLPPRGCFPLNISDGRSKSLSTNFCKGRISIRGIQGK